MRSLQQITGWSYDEFRLPSSTSFLGSKRPGEAWKSWCRFRNYITRGRLQEDDAIVQKKKILWQTSLQFEPTTIPRNCKKYKLRWTSEEVLHKRNPVYSYRRPPVYQPGNCPLRRGSAKSASWVWPDSNWIELNPAGRH